MSLLAANKAASFKIFSKSAPTNPAVFLAIVPKSTSSPNFFFLACTFNISSLALTSGWPTKICLSNLPALNNALSNTSGLFVAAKTITPSLEITLSFSPNLKLHISLIFIFSLLLMYYIFESFLLSLFVSFE